MQAADLVQYSAVNAGSNFKGLLLLTCVNALLYNVVHYLMIQRTSAVTTTVLGEIKIIGLLFASAFLLGVSPVLPTLMCLLSLWESLPACGGGLYKALLTAAFAQPACCSLLSSLMPSLCTSL